MTLVEEIRSFRDPIHGFIDVYPHEVKIIQDPIFQRLRRIKQLSFGYFVYHGAEHSRFGHCLGAMHVASKALEFIQNNTRKFDRRFKIHNEDRLTVRLAALLHDAGHKPFSHALDKTIPGEHEDYSIHLIKKHFVQDIEHAGLDPEYVTALIRGKTDPEKAFLTNLVSGQLDVDKLDYLLRDSHYAGVKYGVYDLDRLLSSLCVKKTNLAVLDDGSHAAIQLVFARYFMFEQVYLHRSKRAYEGMAKEVASYLSEHGDFDYPSIKHLNKQRKIEEFHRYDDAWFLDKILESKDRNYHNIAEQIVSRRHYKEVYNSFQIRRRLLKLNEGSSEHEATAFLSSLEIDVKEKLGTLKIHPSKVIFDDYTNLPYRLRPYSKPLEHEPSEEPATIYIYDKNNDLLEAIETTYPILEPFARYPPRIKRLFVDRTKYDTIHGFLLNKYKKYFKGY